MALKGARGTVSIIDKATSPLKSIAGAFKNMGKASDKANDDLTRTQKVLSGIGKTQNRLNRAAAGIDRQTKGIGSQAVGVAALGLSLKAALNPAIKFEQAMKDLESVAFGAADATVPVAQNMGLLSKQAKQLGSSTAFSATQAAEGQLFLAKAGFKTNEILKSMPGLLDLAAASGTDLGRSSDILSDLLGAFGKTAEDTGKLADVLAAATSSANVDMETLFETLKVAAPIGIAAGQSMEGITTATALLGNVGIKGSMAGTALKNAFVNLASPAAKGAKVLKELGISTSDSAGNMLPLEDIMQSLGEKAKTLSQTKRIKAFDAVFGKIAMAGAINLQKAVTSGDFDKMLKNLQNSEGVAKKMAKIRMDSTEGSITQLMSAVEGIAISFGSILTPILRGTAQVLTALTSPIQNFIKENETLVKVIGVFAGAMLAAKIGVLAYTATMWLISPAIKAFSLALSLSKVPLIAFNALIAANPIGMMAVGVLAVSAAAVALYQNWDKVTRSISNAINELTGFAEVERKNKEMQESANVRARKMKEEDLAFLRKEVAEGRVTQAEADRRIKAAGFGATEDTTPKQAIQQIQANQTAAPVQVVLNAEGVKLKSVQTKGATDVSFLNSGVQQ